MVRGRRRHQNPARLQSAVGTERNLMGQGNIDGAEVVGELGGRPDHGRVQPNLSSTRGFEEDIRRKPP